VEYRKFKSLTFIHGNRGFTFDLYPQNLNARQARPRSGLSRMLIMRPDVLHLRVTIFVVEVEAESAG